MLISLPSLSRHKPTDESTMMCMSSFRICALTKNRWTSKEVLLRCIAAWLAPNFTCPTGGVTQAWCVSKGKLQSSPACPPQARSQVGFKNAWKRAAAFTEVVYVYTSV
jgi:hypothetical protein